VFSTVDAGWDAALDRLPDHDVYFRAAYHAAYEANGDGVARAFVAEEEGDVLFHPFLVRPIPHDIAGPDDLFDIEGVYGYAGPLATTTDPAFLDGAWAAFASHCRNSGVVAEFIRFHPLLGNHRFVGAETVVRLDRETVVLSLDGTPADLWARYPSAQRTRVRQAERAGLVVERDLDEGMPAFRALYDATMTRVDAEPYYRFSDAYFDALRSLRDAVTLFAVRREGSTLASAIFLLHGTRMHYHLGGTTAERGVPAMNALFDGAARWGNAHGYRTMHLGGGRTPSTDDTLFRFKATISRSRASFRIGMRIHDPRAYAALCDAWLSRHAVERRPGYFLLYRLAHP
jgi:hypothetical protein